MTNHKSKLALIAGLAIAIAALAWVSTPLIFAQSSGATIVGQVTVNGTATNGVLVTCGPGSNTTFTYNGTPGYYFIGGLPYETSLPFQATYQGQSYTDSVDPLSSGGQYYQVPTVNINIPTSTPTPTPIPNATATPAPNATITPTPAPNATATPAPNASVTPAPLSITSTPVPPVPTQVPATPVPQEVTATPVPATPVPGLATPTLVPTVMPTMEATVMPSPTAVPSPTQTKSPGFEGLLALSCLLGAAYLVLRKGR